MDLEAAFLADVAANPDDDAPRMAYADWLMEQADPARAARGEFIAAQLSLGRTDLPQGERWLLRIRRQELLQGYRDSWLGPAFLVLQSCHYARGFLDQAELLHTRLPCRDLLTVCGRLFRSEPVLRSLRLTPTSMFVSAEALKGLLALPELPRLTRLALKGCGIDNGRCQIIASSPRLAGLRELLLDENPFTSAGVAVLAASPHLAGLTTLVLNSAGVNGTAPAAALAGSSALARLDHLGLGESDLGEDGLRRLGVGDGLPALTSLGLNNANVIPPRLEALLGGRLAGRLRRLDLSDNPLGVDGARAGVVPGAGRPGGAEPEPLPDDAGRLRGAGGIAVPWRPAGIARGRPARRRRRHPDVITAGAAGVARPGRDPVARPVGAADRPGAAARSAGAYSARRGRVRGR
jgi:uncharacterized protein (TIGR02996 family)